MTKILPNPHVAENNARNLSRASEASMLKGNNVNILSESEWRMIHDALCVMQSSVHWSNPRFEENKFKCQQLMNKIRDEYIAPYNENKTQTNQVSR